MKTVSGIEFTVNGGLTGRDIKKLTESSTKTKDKQGVITSIIAAYLTSFGDLDGLEEWQVANLPLCDRQKILFHIIQESNDNPKEFTLPAGSYKGQDDDIVIDIPAEMPENKMYNLDGAVLDVSSYEDLMVHMGYQLMDEGKVRVKRLDGTFTISQSSLKNPSALFLLELYKPEQLGTTAKGGHETWFPSNLDLLPSRTIGQWNKVLTKFSGHFDTLIALTAEDGFAEEKIFDLLNTPTFLFPFTEG